MSQYQAPEITVGVFSKNHGAFRITLFGNAFPLLGRRKTARRCIVDRERGLDNWVMIMCYS